MIKILLVDDQATVRQGLRMRFELESDLAVVGEAGNGLEAVQMAQALRPDIIVMDVEMPLMNGVTAARQIHESLPHIGLVMFSMHDDPETRMWAQEAGAATFVEKEGSGENLLEAIRWVHRVLVTLKVYQVKLEMQNEELRAAQASLAASRERYLDLYDMAPVGYCTLSQEGVILEANLTAATLLDVAPRALVQQPLSRFIVPEDQDSYYLYRKKLFDTGEPQECELRLVKRDGTIFWAHLSATATRDDHDAHMCRVIISDITARKQMEAAFHQSRMQYQSLVENIPGITYRCQCDPEWTMLFVSDGVMPLTGYPASDFINNATRTYASVIHPDDKAMVLETIHTAIAAGQPWAIEYRMRRQDGDIRWTYEKGRGIYDKDGQVEFLDGFILDITERKHMEDALRESEERFRAIFTEAPISIMVHEKDTGAIVDANAIAYQSYGLPSLEALQTNDFWLDSPYARADALARIHQAVTVGPQSFEWQNRTVSGETFWEHVRLVSITLNGNERVLSTAIDITARKQAEAQIQEYADHLEQMVDEKVQQLERERAKVIQMDKMASLGQQATSVAHELKQPLTAITMDAGYLIELARQAQELRAQDAEAALDLAELEEIGRELQQDVQRARRIIDHLRGFGRLADESLSLVELNQPLEDSFILIGAQLRDHKVTVDWQLAQDLPLIQANPHKLEQVFINLIGNAEYAMQEAAAQDGREKVLTLSTRQEGDWVVAEVRDNGCGISEEAQKRLFEPFFTTKPEGDGTGLGLSICYGIVAACGGEIVCASVPGNGTTFTLRFPRAASSD